MKRILLVMIIVVLLLPVFAAADDGTYFDYEGKIKVSIDVKTQQASIGEPVEFAVVLTNTTPYDFEVTDIEVFDYTSLELEENLMVEAGKTIRVDVSMPMPRPGKLFIEEDKYYTSIFVEVNSICDDPYISLYYASYDLGRVELENMSDGSDLLRMDIFEEDAVCPFTYDEDSKAYYSLGHYAKYAVTNEANFVMSLFDDNKKTPVTLKQGKTYIFEDRTGQIYPNKSEKRNSVMAEYRVDFKIGNEYYVYKQTRIYPTVYWDYNLDLKAEITRFDGEYKSQRPNYENYAVKITNTGKDTIEGFYVSVGEVNRDIFRLSNLRGRLDPSESEIFYFTHRSNEPELKIYTGIVYNDAVYYTNEITCTNMDTSANDIEYDYKYTEYFPHMNVVVSDDKNGKARPEDLTSTSEYDGPALLLGSAESATKPKPKPKAEEPVPTPTPTVVVKVVKQSIIPAWVWVVLPVVGMLVLGLVLFLRKQIVKSEK